jgi:spermidine synthase
MKKPRISGRCVALFLISFSLIAFELGIMRVFALGSWSNFGSMVISIALLGYGVAGVLLTFLQEKVRARSKAWLAGSAIALPAVMALCYAVAQHVPFNPIFLITQPKQIGYIALFYLLYSLPFFVGAVFNAVAFMDTEVKANTLYFWNMAGSGSGGLFLLLSTYFLKTGYLVYPFVAVAALSIPFVLPSDRKNRGRWLGGTAASIAVALFALIAFGRMYVSPYKASEQAKAMFKDLKTVYSETGPLGEYEILKSDGFHFAPGLSDNAVFYIDQMPKNAFWGMYVDNDGPIGIMRRLDASEENYIDFLPMSAAYKVLKDPKVLLVRLGGGFSAYAALYHGAKSVTILEPNPVITKMVKDVKEVREFTGDLLRDPRVKMVEEEPRSFCAKKSSGSYDLVEISLIDSVGLSQSAGYSIGENYVYTVEAFRDYLKRLSDDGVLSVTTWNSLSPPRNVPKLISTVAEALRREGWSEPEKHVYAFDLMYSTATILVKKSPFSDGEIAALDKFCHKMSFVPFFTPTLKDPGKDFRAILASYRDKFRTKSGGEAPAESVKQSMDELYGYSFRWALAGRQEELYSRYLFDIRPTTDDRPYYTVYMKPSTVKLFLDKLTYISEDWSYLLSWATLLQALGFGVVIALIPLFGRKKIGEGPKRVSGVILYYACLGAAYMLVEIYLIQKLVFFLAEPVFSTSIVITSMLIISGVGALLSEKLGKDPDKRVKVAMLGLAATLVFYMFALPGLLKALLGLPLAVKIFVSVLAIAPAAFFMGIPFPTGLGKLQENGKSLLPWAYGVNGALSVTGSLLASVVAMHWGYLFVLAIALVLYLGAGILFPANLPGKKKADAA